MSDDQPCPKKNYSQVILVNMTSFVQIHVYKISVCRGSVCIDPLNPLCIGK